MRVRFLAVALPLVVGALAAGALATPSEAQEVLATRSCTGTYAGMELKGVLVLERWTHERTYRYYGRFQDPVGNVYELEVFTGYLEGGVGGTWVNGMAHRATYINLRVHQEGFVVQTEDGVVVEYRCEVGARPARAAFTRGLHARPLVRLLTASEDRA